MSGDLDSEMCKMCIFSPTTPGTDLLRVTVTCSETDEKNATFKVVTKVRNCSEAWY